MAYDTEDRRLFYRGLYTVCEIITIDPLFEAEEGPQDVSQCRCSFGAEQGLHPRAEMVDVNEVCTIVPRGWDFA